MALLLTREVERVVSAAEEVYAELGPGLNEAVYQEALQVEFERHGIAYDLRPALDISYKQQPLRTKLYPDFVCYDDLLVEIKALPELSAHHHAQLRTFCRVSPFRVALLLNFGHSSELEWTRYNV